MKANKELEKEDILTFLATQKEDFFERFQLVKLGIFGSFATGTAAEASDIDLLVEFVPHTENLHQKKKTLKAIVESRFHRKVDVCREKYLKPYFREQVLNSAIYV